MKEKTLFKSLVPTIAMLMIAVLALSGVTYAWFSSSSTAEVTDFELTVEGAEGLLISADNAVWKSTMTLKEIEAAQTVQTETEGFKLSPVSAANGESNISSSKVTFYTATADGNKLSGSTAASGGYVSFDLYFQNAGSGDKTVYLTNSGVNNGKNGETANALSSALAARIGLIRQGDATIGGAITDAGTTLSIFEPNAETHTSAGTADYKTHFTIENDASKYDTYALKAASTSEIADRWTEGDAIVKTVTTDASGTSFSLPASKTTKVTFYVWIEGQDADCLNDVAGKNITVDLNFTTEAPSSN